MPNEFVARNGLVALNNATITGSLLVSSSNSTQLQVGNDFLYVGGDGNVGFGTLSPSNKVEIRGSAVINIDQDLNTYFRVVNLNPGGFVQNYFLAVADSGEIYFGRNSTGVATSGIVSSSDAFIQNFGGGDIAIINSNSVGSIKLAAGNSSTSHLTIGTTGAATFSDAVTAASFTGSLFGTSSWAVSASWAPGGSTFPYSGSAQITGSLGVTGSTAITGPQANLLVSGTVNVVNFRGSGSATAQSIFTVDGAAGRLFSVNDTLSGSLFSVNTIAGLPVMEVFSTNTVRMGQYGQQVFYISQSRVGIGKENLLNATLDVSGSVDITGSLDISGSGVNITAPTQITGSLNISSAGITGSLFGTASYAITASFALNGGGGGGASSSFSFLTASETLTAGSMVNIGLGGVRRADSGDPTRQAHGFVLTGYAATAAVIVNYSGVNSQTSSLAVGTRYYLGTTGSLTATPPTAIGQLSQEVGVALSPTALLFEPGPAIIT